MMGATLSSIMHSSTKLKNRLVRSSFKAKANTAAVRGQHPAASPTTSSNSKQMSQDTSSSASITHSHTDDMKAKSLMSTDINVSIESESRQSSNGAAGTSEVMNYWISRPSTSHRGTPDRKEDVLGEFRDITMPRRPVTAQPKTCFSRMDTHDQSYHLHKCPSEPVYQIPVGMRRTRSHNVLPSGSSRRSAMDRSETQYVESPSVARGDQKSNTHQQLEQKHTTPKAKQATGDGEAVSNNTSAGSQSQNSNSSSWVTTSCSSEEGDAARHTDCRLELHRHVPREDPSVDKLIRHMEYVATVLKKKMDPLVYNNNKMLFLARILSSQDIQYGYHSNKYIKIGSGEFGEVLYGRVKSTGQLIAIKALKKDKTDMFALLQEAFMLQIASDTEFTPKYFGVVPFTILGDKFQEWAIVLEFVGNSQGPAPYDFRQTLKRAKSAPHTPQLLLEWIYTSAKIVHAVHQFHSKGLLINDIKADNILLRPVGNGYYPVFIDFGLSSIGEGITLALEVNDNNRARILKEYSHIAPEVLFGGETNVASDMFSLGKALSLVADSFQLQPLTNIINQCILWDVRSRPTIPELLNQFQWLSNAIVNRKIQLPSTD